MEFRILGPLEVADGGRVVDLGGPRERVLLARLLLSANLVVSADRLAEDLWSGEPPAHWLPTLRVYISRLRRALGPGRARWLTEPAGYRLRLAAGQLDADVFERLVAAARRDLADGRAEAAAAGLRRALGLWRGPALSGVADLPFARADAARLEEARLSAVEDWVEAELGCGNHAGHDRRARRPGAFRGQRHLRRRAAARCHGLAASPPVPFPVRRQYHPTAAYRVARLPVSAGQAG